VLVAKQRVKHMEKDEWTDKVFTGDNPDSTAHQAQAAGERDLQLNKNAKGRTAMMDAVKTSLRDRLAPMRQTQMSELEAKVAANMLEGKVDMRHVEDIRRVLRRKYASRSNLHKIFAQWDRAKKGGIDAQDIFIGLNKLNIKTTLEEAMALQASAKQQDNVPELSLQEFTELLFSPDENLNDGLKNLNAPSGEHIGKVEEFAKSITDAHW
jgi:Ca2+-binding EF-hand superfamily protein